MCISEAHNSGMIYGYAADRDEVLARLLDLNRRRKEEEAAQDARSKKQPRRRAGRIAAATQAPLFGDDS